MSKSRAEPARLTRVVRLTAKLVLGAAAVLSAVVVVSGAAIYVGHWYSDKFRWRQTEYQKLRSLHAGYSVARFEAVLGTPVFSRKDPKTDYGRTVFVGVDTGCRLSVVRTGR